MRGGFDANLPIENESGQRADKNIPLSKFHIAGVDWEIVRKSLELPDQYLRTCTLREGTVITLCIYQTMSLGTAIFLTIMLVIFPDETEYWWKEKFRNDLDYYYQDENVELIDTLYPLWRPLCLAVIGVHAGFFLTGWLVFYALFKKDTHPCWYMPWILMSCFLSTVHWLICGTMILTTFLLAFYRDISVTWDLVPISCTIVYGVGWTYSCVVVIAHYRRRTIVRFWKEKQHLVGTETYPPEITEYLYQYGKAQ